MVMVGYMIDSITNHNHFSLEEARMGRIITSIPEKNVRRDVKRIDGRSIEKKIDMIDERLEELPRGTLTYKNINGKRQPYIQRTVDGKSVSYYVKVADRERILMEFQERSDLLDMKKRLQTYVDGIKDILKNNPYMANSVGCGQQNFEKFAEDKLFYVDKTGFISEWMANGDDVTLITRPRRFGKTLLLSTVEHFFDPRFADHPEYFDKLAVWKNPLSRQAFGRVPVVSVSFGGCKGRDYRQSIKGMVLSMHNMYEAHSYLADSDKLSEVERSKYSQAKKSLFMGDDSEIETAIQTLCMMLYKHHGVYPLILHDEYDTPLIEAYTDGYWDEMIATCRQIFHNSFKENPYFWRTLITGITRVSKNSLFSDLNNVKVYTMTSDKYTDCCGFTEKEVMDALKCHDIDRISDVKAMYDGFIVGSRKDIYNPWSINNYMCEGQLQSFWVNTGSNKLIGDIIRRHPVRSKYEIEQLVNGEVIHKCINENITFQYLDGDENSLWSLLLAVGYVKADNVVMRGELTECDVSVTNQEVMEMFRHEIRGMMDDGEASYNYFVDALLGHKVDDLNDILLDITYTSVSYFDVGKRPSDKGPENFSHGLVLGLIVSLKDRYRIVSNRESGRGRYDIAMYPKSADMDAFIMEFKVRDAGCEDSLEQTAERAVRQIDDKNYVADLLAAGIPENRIYKLGFAFEGKDSYVIEVQ